MSISIAGQSTIPQPKLRAYAVSQGAHQRYLDALPLWYLLGDRYGIAGDNAAIQAAKETAYGNYGGVVPAGYHNWCGLKTRTGGSNTDPAAHAQFSSDSIGIEAQFQHLAAYAGIALPPGAVLVDPRYVLINKGIALTYAQLGTHWAPAANYGTQIESMIQSARKYADDGIRQVMRYRKARISGISTRCRSGISSEIATALRATTRRFKRRKRPHTATMAASYRLAIITGADSRLVQVDRIPTQPLMRNSPAIRSVSRPSFSI